MMYWSRQTSLFGPGFPEECIAEITSEARKILIHSIGLPFLSRTASSPFGRDGYAAAPQPVDATRRNR
jgi:hypothetical protein